MIWVKKHPFSKQGINNPNKFMSYSKDGLFKGQTLGKASFKIVFKNTVKSNSFMCHKPDNSSQMFISSFLVVLGVKGSRCASRPILHDDKGLKSPTNLSWIREAGNRLLKGLYGPKEMSSPTLPPFYYLSIKIT